MSVVLGCTSKWNDIFNSISLSLLFPAFMNILNRQRAKTLPKLEIGLTGECGRSHSQGYYHLLQLWHWPVHYCCHHGSVSGPGVHHSLSHHTAHINELLIWDGWNGTVNYVNEAWGNGMNYLNEKKIKVAAHRQQDLRRGWREWEMKKLSQFGVMTTLELWHGDHTALLMVSATIGHTHPLATAVECCYYYAGHVCDNTRERRERTLDIDIGTGGDLIKFKQLSSAPTVNIKCLSNIV